MAYQERPKWFTGAENAILDFMESAIETMNALDKMYARGQCTKVECQRHKKLLQHRLKCYQLTLEQLRNYY